MSIMTQKTVRHLVVRDGGVVNGLISIGDVVKAIIDDQQFTIEQLEHYISGHG
jgi:IMP dehydrogenase